MGTKFKDYLAESKAADAPEEAAERRIFAAAIALGLQFRDARVALDMTQVEVAQASGVPQADISRIERGGGNPTQVTLQKIASVLGYRVGLVAGESVGAA